MHRDNSYFRRVLEEDEYLDKIFRYFCEYSTVLEDFGLIKPHSVKLDIILNNIQQKFMDRDKL